MSNLYYLVSTLKLLSMGVPLAGLWALPQRRWVSMFLLIGLLVVASFFKAFGDYSEPINIALGSVPRALAVLVPVAMVVGVHWSILQRNLLFWLVVLVPSGLLVFLATVVILGEARYNRDAMYCWDAAHATSTDCPLNPWLLGSVALGYMGLAIYIYGTIPALAILGFAGWRRRLARPVT